MRRLLDFLVILLLATWIAVGVTHIKPSPTVKITLYQPKTTEVRTYAGLPPIGVQR